MIRYCALGCVGLLLAGCSSAGFDRFGGNRTAQLPASPTGQVESQTLSPLVLGEPNANQMSDPNYPSNQPINNAMGAEAEFAQGQSQPFGQSAGRSGGQSLTSAPATARELGRTDLLGAWTLASGAEQCSLNVNLTNWTGGYRASTRGCGSSDLQRINAWVLDGKQVVLLAEDGQTVIARLYSTSPARFDGQAEMDGRAVSFFR